jgi:hypothetical protein
MREVVAALALSPWRRMASQQARHSSDVAKSAMRITGISPAMSARKLSSLRFFADGRQPLFSSTLAMLTSLSFPAHVQATFF